MGSSVRFEAAELLRFAASLLEASGLAADRSEAVAQVLLEGDLLGHDTHGLQLLASYLAEIEAGRMTLTGDPSIVNERAAVITWDGRRLPGPWLVLRALDAAAERAAQYGTGTVVIRRSHHIACLAAYLQRATDRGLVMMLLSSDPNSASVAPFGGTRAVFSPNPLAAGFPTRSGPVMLDVSTSTTTNGMAKRLHREGRRFAQPWLLDAAGHPTDDPATLFTQPPGTILPLGGVDVGHKGYALSLLVEALTGGLAGFGHADPREGWGATVYLHVIDPAAFAGRDEFERQSTKLTALCRDNPPRDGVAAVRVPGEMGLQRKTAQQREGVALHPAVIPLLQPWADKFGVAVPSARAV
jgi:L-lactate dehydrogenase